MRKIICGISVFTLFMSIALPISAKNSISLEERKIKIGEGIY
ncbi:hypothetical protein ACFQWC_00015 [Rossellomorea sp. GCM10028870]